MFDMSIYNKEINSTYFSDFMEVWDDVKTEEDFLTAIVYAIQQGTGFFNRSDAPLTKKFFIEHMMADEIESYKGVSWAIDGEIINTPEQEVKSRLNKPKEFDSTTWCITIAHQMAKERFHYKGNLLWAVLKMKGNQYFKIDGNTRDFGEKEIVLRNGEIADIVECGFDIGSDFKESKSF